VRSSTRPAVSSGEPVEPLMMFLMRLLCVAPSSTATDVRKVSGWHCDYGKQKDSTLNP